MATTSEDAPLRPTGNMERMNILRNHINFYSNIQVSATYALPSGFITTYSLLPIIQSALASTIKTHPILGVTIQDEGTSEPKWQHLPSITVSKILKIIEHDDPSHDSWITDGHRSGLHQVDILPPWRLIIATSSTATDSFTLAFYAHHAICDGMSAGAFHITFLLALNNLIVEPSLITSQPTIPIPKQPLLDTLEQRTTLPVSPFFVAKALFKAWIYKPSSPLTWTGPPITSTPPSSPPVSNLLTFSLAHEKVEKLVAKCREQKTTLTSLISVLIARHLAVTKGPTYKRFVGGIPFSLRKWTNHTPTDMGCYVSGLSPLFSSEENTPRGYISCLSFADVKGVEQEDEKMLWSAARECRRFVQDGTRSEKNQIVGLLSFVSDIKEYFLSRLGTKREHTFEVTNIGGFDGGLLSNVEDEDGNLKARFDNMIFSTALCTYGDPFCVSVVSVRGGKMNLGVNWVEEVTGGGNARALKEWLEGSLDRVAEGYVPGENFYVEDEVVGKEMERRKVVAVLTAAGVAVFGALVWGLI